MTVKKEDTCYKKAIEVIKNNKTPKGFKASKNFYNSVWSRDGIITSLGALLVGDDQLEKTTKKTLSTLMAGQTELGQIPNAFFMDVGKFAYYATDSNLWWIIGVWNYVKKTHDMKFAEECWPALTKATRNSQAHVIDDTYLITQPEAGDWMDTSIARKGKLLYTNCLYYKATECMKELNDMLGKKEKFPDPAKIKKMINILLWPEKEGKNFLSVAYWDYQADFFEEGMKKDRMHYINYLSFEFFEDRCDVLGSLLAILFGVAPKDKASLLIKYLERRNASSPYPVKVLLPPVYYPNPTWNPKIDLYRKEQHHNLPFSYHNGGIWPYVGAFYILALLKAGKKKKASVELARLAEANRQGKKEWEFNEWLHGKTGEAKGAKYQTWSAAMYVAAYRAVKGEKIF